MKKTIMALALCLTSAIGFANNRQVSAISAHDDEPEDEPIDSEKIFYPNAHMDKQERERFIRSWVEQIGAPCAPLLIGHLWEYKSMATLAQELGYSNADSAKSQKAKCMQKVKTFIKNKLIEYGYEY